MPTYKTPGVFVEEISTLPASVAGVATAIPGFMGFTQSDAGAGEPVRITSMVEYEEAFGGPFVGWKYNVDTSTLSSVTGGYVFYYHMQMYFANGGGPCWVMSVGDYTDTIAKTSFQSANSPSGDGFLDKLGRIDEVTLLVAPEAPDEDVYVDMMAQCASLQDRFSILDVLSDPIGSGATYRDDIGSSNLKYGASYYPNLNTALSYPDSSILLENSTVQLNVNGTDVSTALLSDAKAFGDSDTQGVINSIIIDLDAKRAAKTIVLTPSASIAGIYASVDRTRGVWKAPANVSIANVVGPSIALTNDDQDRLNVDATTGKSINAIRSFAGKGTLVWGARTLAGNDNEWRYVPVRRLFITAEESIKKASEFVVFEPNDANTWVRMKVMIENYLTGLWKDGALAGATAEDAYFVNVGLGSTMTSQDILEGRMIVEIGMAAVRPAEFIILRFSHKLQES